jgi:hypothetical protein
MERERDERKKQQIQKWDVSVESLASQQVVRHEAPLERLKIHLAWFSTQA